VTKHRLFNPGPSPVVYDAEGHSVPAHGFCDAEVKDERTARLIERGSLLDVGTTAKAEKAEKES